jgi:hypothetical protein
VELPNSVSTLDHRERLVYWLDPVRALHVARLPYVTYLPPSESNDALGIALEPRHWLALLYQL